MGKARAAQGQWPNWGSKDWSEYPTNDPKVAEVWGYTGKLSYAWEARSLNQPAVTTFGANGTRRVYSRFGGTMPRASGGFTVYRPNHWSLAGTDLYYGDVFGNEVPVCGYEGDGDLAIISEVIFGHDSEKNRAKIRYGSVVMTNMAKGQGEVFCAGTTEWGYALTQRDVFSEKITHNVLNRFARK